MKKQKTTNSLPRTPASHIPREVAVRCLITTPKLSSQSRKRFKRALGKVVNIECAEPKSEQETFCRKLKSCSMAQLGRRRSQNRTRICHLMDLRDSATTAKIRVAMERALDIEIYKTDWIRDEIDYRTKPVKAVV